MLRRGQRRQRNGRGDAHRVRQPYDLDNRPEYVSVPARGLLASSYIALRGDLITPRTQPDPNPVSDGPRPHQVAGLPRATRQAVACRVLSQESGTTRFSVVDKWGSSCGPKHRKAANDRFGEWPLQRPVGR